MLNTLLGATKYSQRHIEALQCNVLGCTSGYRYTTASGAVFCFSHWRYYLAIKVIQYLHQQAMIDAIKQQKGFNESSLKQRVLEVCSLSNDEILMLLTQHDIIVKLVDDINTGALDGIDCA
jgi:hypothetical protein